MDWRLKCVAFHVLRFAPRSVHSALQRHVTGRYFFELTDAELAAYSSHLEHFRGGRALEFGCGNLLSALLLSTRATEVLAYDLTRLARLDQVNHVIRQLRGRIAGDWPEIRNLDDDLFQRYRIRYLAPADARATGLPAGSVNFVYSTSTLEHIPPQSIAQIITECKRVTAPDARFSFIIDYHDHYASADPAITRFHFYRFGPALWRLFNPANHYQNRLRHSDYMKLFAELGLKSIAARSIIPADSPAKFSDLARCFKHYSSEDLAALNGIFVLHG